MRRVASTVRSESTEDELRKLAAAWAERTAIEQGLPPKVSVLREVARVLQLSKQEQSDVK
jgi:hypothetical protein